MYVFKLIHSIIVSDIFRFVIDILKGWVKCYAEGLKNKYRKLNCDQFFVVIGIVCFIKFGIRFVRLV